LLDELRPLALALMDEALMGLSAPEKEQLQDLLERVRTNLSRRTTRELALHG
jgi:DNA-binding MarR family transcriptional regulator